MAAPDYLDDPYAGAAAVGSARAYGDLGYAAPRSGLADTAGYQSPLEAPPARSAARAAPSGRATSFKPVDPLDDPDYKRAALARKELHDNEQFATQRLRDFDANEGKQLFAQQKALDAAHKTLAATDQSNLGAAALNAHPRPANYRALTQTRQRLADEAARIRTTRQAFDDTTFMPMRNRLMSGAGRQQQDDTPPANDVLQQRDGFWTTRWPRATDLRVGPAEPSPAPGSVGAGNFTQPAATAPTNGSGTPDLTPQNNPPGDEARGEIEARAPAEAPTAVDSGAKGGLRQVFGPAADALDDGALADRRQAMASDLKAKWGGGSVADRVKMIFGRDGYGQNEPEMPEQMIGSEAAGTKGSLYTIPKMQGTGVGAGIVNAANKFSSGMTTAENAALMAATGGAGALAELGGATAIGRAAQAAKAVAIGGFTAQMASGLPESVRNAYRVYHDPKSTDAEKAEALATPGFEAAMTALAAHGAVGEGRLIGDRARGESAPTYNKEPNFVGDLDLNRARLDTANAKLAEANQRMRGVLDRGAGPQIGPNVETLANDHGELAGDKINGAWTAFTPESQSLGVPRDEMPQVHAEDRGALTQFLKARGITHAQEEILPSELKPTQAEFSPSKVEKARGFSDEDRAILVSADNHVVDGHHQWMAKLADAPDKPMRVIRLNAPIDEVLPQVKEFPSAETSGGANPVSSEQKPSATESNEREPRPEEPINPRGIDPGQRVEPPGTVRDQPLRSDVGGAGEQPRGSEVERPAPGQGVAAAPDADERHAGDAGQPVLQPAAAQQLSDTAGSGAASARGTEGDLGGGGERGPGLAGEGGGRDAGAVTPGIISGGKLEDWADKFLQERRGQTSSGLDPQLGAAYAIKAAALFERGVRDRVAWGAEMVRRFGDEIKEHLGLIWDQMHAYLKDPTLAEKATSATPPAAREGGFVLAPQNQRDASMSIGEAKPLLDSPEQKAFEARIKELNPNADVRRTLGKWEGTAEPSATTFIPKGTAADAERLALQLGAEQRQLGVGHGVFEKGAPDLFVSADFPKGTTHEQVNAALDQAGIKGAAIEQNADGTMTAHIFDKGRQLGDNIEQLHSHELHPTLRSFDARGDFAGGSTRDEAVAGYERRLREISQQPAGEAQHPDGGVRDRPPGASVEAGGGPSAPARPVPPETAQVGGGGESAPIGVKNASVDEQRAQLGLPPSEERHGTTQAEAHAAAIARIAADKDAGTKLVDQLHASPRAPDATENLILDAELVARRKAVAAAEKRWQAAASAGDKEAMESASHEATEAQAAYTKAMDVSTAVGTKSSDSLNMRKAMLKEDFSLAELTRKQERLNRGKPVTEKQKATIRKEHEDFESTKADYEKKLAESEQKRAEAEADLALQKLTTKVAWERKGPPQPRGTILKTYVDHERAAGEAAMARIKARIASGKVGLNPIADPELIKDWVAVGRHYLAEGVLKAHDLGEALIKGIGEHVRPYINEIVSKSIKEREEYLRGLSSGRDTPAERRSTVSTMKERVAEGDSIGDLGHYVNKIAEQHLRDGVKGREPLLDAVHSTLKEVKPDITRRETMDALSGYGQLKPLNPDPIKAELRDIKGQSQQIAKLQDMQAGQGPLKTGVERRIPSDEERRLIKQVEEAKKKGGYDVTDPAKQLKTSLDATKTRLANQIKDLDFQISTGKKIVRDKTQAPTDAEADALRAKRDALKKEYDEMFKKPGLTDEQRIRLATASVTRAIADYEGRIKAGAYQKRTQGAAGPTNSALDALRARRDALREQLEDLRNQANPAKTPGERALQARKTYLSNRTAKLMEQLTKDDFSKPPPRPRLTDRALENAQAAHESVKKRVQQRMHDQEQANRTPAEKAIDAIPKISRFGVLSYPSVIAKLAAAAAARVAHSVVREGVISGLRQVPGIKGVAAKAPRFGSGLQLEAEVKAHTDGMMRAIRASGEYLKNREPQERLLYGKAKPDREWSNYLGRIHGALKTPASMTEFERSYYKRSLFDARRGLDPNNPTIKMQNSVAALKDADRSIFLQDNKLVDSYRSAVATFRRPDKGEVAPSLANRSIAAGIETAVPIVKVPTNIVGEVLEHIHGPFTGAVKAILAHREGLDQLKPEAADAIMRQLATGVMGNALLAAGWYLYKNIGPFHQQREKPRTEIPKEGTAVVGGTEVPKVALHNPAFTTMQVAATAHHLMDGLAGKKGSDPSTEWSVVKALFGLADATPFGRETIDASKMIEDPAGTIPRTIGSRVVPGLLQQTAQFMDKDATGAPIARKPDGVWQNIELGIPGLRQNVPTAPPPKVPQGRRQSLRDYLDRR